MKVALIGPGQLGRVVFRAAAGERLVICEALSDAEAMKDQAELGLSTEMKAAGQCQVAAVTVPAPACPGVFDSLCPHMAPGSIVLNFATGWVIPEELRARYPQIFLLEAKVIGSAMGMAQGLKGMIVLGCDREDIVAQVREALPGLKFQPGDSQIAKFINTLGTKVALSAALELEEELQAKGIPEEMINTAVGGLMPGVLISYSKGTLGEFARKVEADLRKERADRN